MKKMLKNMLILPLILALLFACAGAVQVDPGYFVFEVSYVDGNGETQTFFPAPVYYEGYENSFWVNVPQEALSSGLTLTIADDTDTVASFSPASGSLISAFDAGSTLTGATPVYITGYDAGGNEICQLQLYFSTVAYEPEAPEAGESEILPQTVTVYYRDTNGQDVASAQDVTLEGGTQPVYANPTDLTDNYVLTTDSVQYVTVDETGASPYEVVFYYVYQAPYVEPVCVPVRYVDSSYKPVASDGAVYCEEGITQVYADPYDLQPDYQLLGDGVQTVTVDANGANPQEVVFFYQYAAPVPQSVNVPVYYLSQEGTQIAPQDTIECGEGSTQVYANPIGLDENYQLMGSSVQMVTVSQGVASPQEIIFYYEYVEPYTEPEQTEEPTPAPQPETPAPAPKVALIPVSYVLNDTGRVILTDTETFLENSQNIISARDDVLPEGYQLSGDHDVLVFVDENGIAQPASVTFRYDPVAQPVMDAYVNILYQAENGLQVASPTQQKCQIGENIVYAAPVDLQNGYDLKDIAPKVVTLWDNGALSQDSVTFYYIKSEHDDTPNDDDTPDAQNYDLTPLNGYAYPRTDSVNFRSFPSNENKNNIIRTINKNDLMTLMGETTDTNGSLWYFVSIGQTAGFIKADFARILSQQEIDALFGVSQPEWTQTPEISNPPVQQVTQPPAPIAEGEPIDRWAEVTSKSVNFRSSRKASGSNRIASLSRGTKVWVYDAQTIDGTTWYSVRYKDKDGYIVSDYLELYSAEDSNAFQMSLPTPMVTQTPIPTRVPTATPTLVPTITPTRLPTIPPTQTPTPTLAPNQYAGYGVTTSRAAVRSGIGWGDENIIETVESNNLVYITAQTYVSDTCWDSVTVLSSGSTGFMEDARLRRISSEEAKYYIDLLAPVETPTAAPTQVPFTGYAKTLGDGVPLRTYMDTNAQIELILDANSVVNVYAQQTVGGDAWCQVQYGNYYGYIRRDMIQQMNEWEISGYLQSLHTPTPTPVQLTPAPITGSTLSSYGYVSGNRVNLRKTPTKNGTNSLKLMNQYDFALVMGTEDNNEGTWYHILQNGTEGYVLSNYFKLLTMNELSDFLTSDQYSSTSNNTSGTQASQGTASLQAVEDYNQGVWQNPALTASYEPFNPYQTAAPDPRDQVTQAPTASPTPTASLSPITLPTQVPESKGGGFPVGLIVAIVVIAAAGCGIYAYTLHRRNERRRAALRAQQARRAQQAAQAQRPMSPRPPYQNMGETQRYNPQQAARPTPMNRQQTAPYNPQATMNAQRRFDTETNIYHPTAQQQTPFARPYTNEQPQRPAPQPFSGQQNQQAYTQPTQQPYTPEQPAQPAQTGRRRRTERYHHDDSDEI